MSLISDLSWISYLSDRKQFRLDRHAVLRAGSGSRPVRINYSIRGVTVTAVKDNDKDDDDDDDDDDVEARHNQNGEKIAIRVELCNGHPRGLRSWRVMPA